MDKYPITFKPNGNKVSVEAPATTNLLTLLRDYLDVTSVKFGCEQGNCGACTVILDGEAVNLLGRLLGDATLFREVKSGEQVTLKRSE